MVLSEKLSGKFPVFVEVTAQQGLAVDGVYFRFPAQGRTKLS
jgi:hypothetical protein